MLHLCDTGQPFIMVISEESWHSHLLPSVWQWSCHYLFSDLSSNPRFPTCEAKALPLSHRGGRQLYNEKQEFVCYQRNLFYHPSAEHRFVISHYKLCSLFLYVGPRVIWPTWPYILIQHYTAKRVAIASHVATGGLSSARITWDIISSWFWRGMGHKFQSEFF